MPDYARANAQDATGKHASAFGVLPKRKKYQKSVDIHQRRLTERKKHPTLI
jgi:hypothetical protein